MEKLRFTNIWLAVGFLSVGLVIYVSLMPNPPDLTHMQGGDKIEHAAAYFTLTFWFGQIYARNRVRWAIGTSFYHAWGQHGISPAHDRVSDF